MTRIVVSQQLRIFLLYGITLDIIWDAKISSEIWYDARMLSEMQSELVTPGSAFPLLLQWMSSFAGRCQGCPSWSRRAWRLGLRCSTAGSLESQCWQNNLSKEVSNLEFEVPLEDSARCKPPAPARCEEPPSARRCRRSPDATCQSEQTLHFKYVSCKHFL